MKTHTTLIQYLKNKLHPIDHRNKALEKTASLAAVLIPIITHEDKLTVLFTKRTDHLANHPGQVSFPGGRMEAQDSNLVATVLRETHEEIGLAASEIELIGQLTPTRTVSGQGFLVTPFVGLVSPPLHLVTDSYEVDYVFEVPFDYLCDLNHFQRKQRLYQGKQRQFYLIEYDHQIIWGATATMLHNLAELLRTYEKGC